MDVEDIEYFSELDEEDETLDEDKGESPEVEVMKMWLIGSVWKHQ